MLHWALVDQTDPNIPMVLPIMVRLMSVNGTETTPGTEVVGDAYDPAEVSFGYTEGVGSAIYVNISVVEYNSVDTSDSKTVVGVELWDSSDVPIRIGLAALDAPLIVSAGTPFSIAPGQLKVSLT